MFAVAACLGPLSPGARAASWTTTTPLPETYQGHALAYSSSRLFHTGGISYNGGILDGLKVFSATTDGGTVGSWTPAPALPEAVYYHASVAVNGHLYVLGGFHYTDADGVVISNLVYRSNIGGGSVGAWQTATPLPQPVFFPSAAAWNGRIYVTGGWNGSALLSAVYSADVLQDGSLGPWVAHKSLPEAVYTHAAVSNGTLYVLGGTVNGGNEIQNSVSFAKINPDGSLADWAATTPLPSPVSNHGAVVANGRVIALGGWTGDAPTAAVHSALVESAGSLGGWSPETPLPRALYLIASAASPSHVFVSGGLDLEAIRGDVYSLPLPPPPPPTDSLAPRTSLAFGAPAHGEIPFISPQTPATLTAVDDAHTVGDGAGVGVASTRWSVDDGAFNEYTAPIRVPNDGAHWIRFLSVDGLGHAEAPRAAAAAVDGTAPVSSLTAGSPQATLAGGELIIGPATALAVSALDPVVNGSASGVARVFAGLDGAAPAESAAPFVLPAPDGPHTVTMRSEDNVGNAELLRSATIYRDATAPATVLFLSSAPYEPADGGAPIIGAGTTFGFTAEDPATGGIAAGVHHTEYSLDGGEPASYTGPFGLPEGARALTYRSMDNVANAEAPRTASYRVDLTAPQSALTWDGAPAAPTTDSEFTLTALDPVSNGVASGVNRVLYSVDGAPDAAYAGKFKLAEGSHALAWQVWDHAGNAGDRESATIAVGSADSLPPRTALAFGAPSHGPVPFIAPLTPAVLTAVDDARAVGDGAGAGVASTQWALDDGTFSEYAGPIHVVDEGAHWIRYRSVDALGRAEDVRASSAAVDGTAPVSSLSVGSPQATLEGGQLIVGPGTLIAVAASDPASGGVASGVSRVLAGVDGAEPSPVSAPFILPSADGVHTVAMRSDDNVGNAEAPHSVTVYRDGSSPATVLTISPPPYAGPSGPVLSASGALSFAASDPVSGGVAAGVHHTEYSLDGGSWTVFTGAFGAAEGAHAISYRSVDNVANSESVISYSFRTDATPPQTTLAVDGGGATLFGQDVVSAGSRIVLTAEDPVSGGGASGVKRIVYSLDGGSEQPYSAPFTLSAGRHQIRYGAEDNAGNDEDRLTATVTVGSFLSDALAATGRIGLAGKAGVVGDVRTNSAFTAKDKSFVDGDVAGLTVTLDDKSTVSGTITRGPDALTPPDYDLAAARVWARANNNNAAIPARFLSGGTLVLDGRETLTLPAGDYYLTGLRLRGRSSVAAAGRVNLFLDGPMTVRGGSGVNASGDAASLWIVSAYDGRDAYESRGHDDDEDDEDDDEDRRERDYAVFLNGVTRAAFNLYAPLASFRAKGKGQFAGRVLAQAASLSGKTLQPSTTVLPPPRRDPGPRIKRPLFVWRGGNGTGGGGHAHGRDRLLVSCLLDARAPAPVASSPAAPPPATLAFAAPAAPPPLAAAAPRPSKRFTPAPPRAGPGTAGRGLSSSGHSSVASSRLERAEPAATKGAAVRPASPTLAGAAPEPRRSRRSLSKMPSLTLARRAAFSAIASNGGAVRAQDRSAVVIPEGAATTGIAVTVSPPKKSDVLENRRQSAVESRKGLVAAAIGVQYGPEGTHFTKPVTLELPYDRASLPKGISENDLRVHYWNPVTGDWETLESSVDTQNQIVRAQTTHFSLYQIFGGGSPSAAPSTPNDPAFQVNAGYAFPNPSRGAVPVVLRMQPGRADSVSVRVYDLAGRLVHESSDFRDRNVDDLNGFGSQITFDHTWDVSSVASGVYTYIMTARKAGAGDIRKSGKVGVIR